jgi:tight adherence protein B
MIDVLIFISVIIVVLLIGSSGRGAKRKLFKKRIVRLKQRKAPAAKSAVDMSLRRKHAEEKGFVYWVMKPLPDFKKLGDRLERAQVKITTQQFLFRRMLAMIVITFVLAVIFKKSLIMAVSIALILGVWVPFKIISYKINKQSKAFLRLFPDAIDLIVRGLRAGLPVSESIVLVSEEVPAPVGGVFATISNTMKLGVTLESALQETAQKLDLTEFNFFTTSVILQRETGGNLSEILNNLSEVLRGRFIMRMKIKAMSSEARASAYIIGALPFVVLLAVSVLSPDYIKPLYQDYRGNICAAIAVGMMVSGGWIMNRMTQFEI